MNPDDRARLDVLDRFMARLGREIARHRDQSNTSGIMAGLELVARYESTAAEVFSPARNRTLLAMMEWAEAEPIASLSLTA